MPIILLYNKELKPSARLLWGYLRHRQGKNETAWPSQKTIADDLGISVKTVKRDIADLEKTGLLEVIPPEASGPGYHNQYVVNDPPKGQKQGSNLPLSRGQIFHKQGSNLPSNKNQGTRTNKKGKNMFVPPTPGEVEEYARSIDYPLDGQHFVEYYSAADWHLNSGKPMQNWKQAVVTWKHRRKPKSDPPKAFKPFSAPRTDDTWDPSPEEAVRLLGVG